MAARPATLIEALIRAATFPEVVVRFQNRPGRAQCYNYAELLSRARRVAASLEKMGVKRGDRVAIVLPTAVDFYDVFFGVLYAGAVPAALYPPVRLGRLDEWKDRSAAMLASLPATLVISDRRLGGLVGHPAAQAEVPLGVARSDRLLNCEPAAAAAPITPSDLACVQFSSGTTGQPKPVALSHQNMLANAAAIMATLPGDLADHSGVSWLPLYHDMGLVGALLVALLAPGDLTLIPPERFIARPRLWLEVLSETGATVSVAPNFAYSLCAERVTDLEGLDLSRWQVALCGAEPVHPSTLRRFNKRFAEVGLSAAALTPVYGLAEATLAMTFSALTEPFSCLVVDPESIEKDRRVRVVDQGRELISLGPPLAGSTVQIRRFEQVCEEGEVGRVFLSGPGVMCGYLGRPEATAAVLVDGWLDSGDEGFLWRGELYLTGRAKDLIIVRGRNHDPAVIEQTLDGIDGLRRGCTAAFAVPGAATESLGLIAETSGPPNDAVIQSIREAVRLGVGLDPALIELVPAGSLPRTSSGKIRRQEAARRWSEGTLSAPAQPGVLRLLAASWAGRRKMRRR